MCIGCVGAVQVCGRDGLGIGLQRLGGACVRSTGGFGGVVTVCQVEREDLLRNQKLCIRLECNRFRNEVTLP